MKEELLSEHRYKDEAWRISHSYKIRDKNGDLVTFKPNTAQAHFYANRTRRNFILKSRQLGISTMCGILEMDKAIHTPGYTAGIFAHSLEDAKKLFDAKVTIPIRNLPGYLSEGVELAQDQDKSMKIEHEHKDDLESRIFVSASARSDTISSAHISELERMEEKEFAKAKEVFEGTIGAVPIDGTINIECTPRLSDGIFKQHFMAAWNAERKPNYNPKIHGKAFFYNWRWDIEGIALAPEYHPSTFPEEMLEYQRQFKLTQQELNYFYFHWSRVGGDWSTMRKEYPTTIAEAFQANRVGAAFSDMMSLMYNENRIRHVPYDPQYPVFAVFDLGVNDATSIVWLQIISNEYRVIDHYRNTHKPIKHYIQVLNDKMAHRRLDMTYLPHDAEQHHIATNESVTDYFDYAQMSYRVMPPSKEKERVRNLRKHAHHMVIDSVQCAELVVSLGKCHYRNPDDKKMVHGIEQNDFDALSQSVMFIDDETTADTNTQSVM